MPPHIVRAGNRWISLNHFIDGEDMSQSAPVGADPPSDDRIRLTMEAGREIELTGEAATAMRAALNAISAGQPYSQGRALDSEGRPVAPVAWRQLDAE